MRSNATDSLWRSLLWKGYQYFNITTLSQLPRHPAGQNCIFKPIWNIPWLQTHAKKNQINKSHFCTHNNTPLKLSQVLHSVSISYIFMICKGFLEKIKHLSSSNRVCEVMELLSMALLPVNKAKESTNNSFNEKIVYYHPKKNCFQSRLIFYRPENNFIVFSRVCDFVIFYLFIYFCLLPW